MPRLTGSAPHFLVADVVAAVDFYVEVLGFERPPLWGDPPVFALPSRDGYIVMLNQVEARQPTPLGHDIWDAYFWCDDADALCAQFLARGASIDYGPLDRPEYGNREFGLRDPDGYLLAFASDLGK